MSKPAANIRSFPTLAATAKHLRKQLREKKYILMFAYNGTGKTRLSMAFKDLGKQGDERDTLYFNAFTEDLFTWDNDLDGDARRVLKINRDSRFFRGLEELEMESRIAHFLHNYTDFDFIIDYEHSEIIFFRERTDDEEQAPIPIKVSRGEENIFIWCFFLAVARLAIDEEEPYDWVKYLYIDDPISSLDDNHTIAVATDLARLLRWKSKWKNLPDVEAERKSTKVKSIISTHHHLFFNIMWNESKKEKGNKYVLNKNNGNFILTNTKDTPRFHHVMLLKQLIEAKKSNEIYTWHFNMLRNLLEKTATFHGFSDFSDCIKKDNDDPDGRLRIRILGLLSHGNYSLYEPVEMLDENKRHFHTILDNFLNEYSFNPELYSSTDSDSEASAVATQPTVQQGRNAQETRP